MRLTPRERGQRAATECSLDSRTALCGPELGRCRGLAFMATGAGFEPRPTPGSHDPPLEPGSPGRRRRSSQDVPSLNARTSPTRARRRIAPSRVPSRGSARARTDGGQTVPEDTPPDATQRGRHELGAVSIGACAAQEDVCQSTPLSRMVPMATVGRLLAPATAGPRSAKPLKRDRNEAGVQGPGRRRRGVTRRFPVHAASPPGSPIFRSSRPGALTAD